MDGGWNATPLILAVIQHAGTRSWHALSETTRGYGTMFSQMDSANGVVDSILLSSIPSS